MNLTDYRALCTRTHCRWCETLLPDKVDHYTHAGGYQVEGFPKPQWLSVHCPNPKCGYDWSLWKLGAPSAYSSILQNMGEVHE